MARSQNVIVVSIMLRYLYLNMKMGKIAEMNEYRRLRKKRPARQETNNPKDFLTFDICNPASRISHLNKFKQKPEKGLNRGKM